MLKISKVQDQRITQDSRGDPVGQGQTGEWQSTKICE